MSDKEEFATVEEMREKFVGKLQEEAKAVEKRIVNPYNFRKLTGEDIWPVIAAAGKVLPEDLAPVFVDLVTDERPLKDKIDEIGGVVFMRLVKAIISNIGTIKDDVYDFLTDVSGMTREEINAQGLMAVPKMIWAIYNAEKNVDFFEDASKSS